MTIEELGDVLGVAAAFDNRTVGDADILAWYSAIGHINAGEAREAVIAHYTENTDRVMPAHVLTRVGKIRALRLAHAGPEAVPDVDNPDDWRAYQEALREGRWRTANGELKPRPVRRAIEGTFRQVDSKWNRNIIAVPIQQLAIEAAPQPEDPEHAAASKLLAGVPDARHWIEEARRQLEAEGARLTRASVAIRAADLATRPDAESGDQP